MPFTIPVSYVHQFSSNVHMLSEQEMSRFMPGVEVMNVTGESFSVERLGGIDTPNEVNDLGGDTPLNPLPHSRRWGYIKSFDVADRISKVSDIRLLIDPRSNYTTRHAGTMGRAMDDEIISALVGSARSGKNGETSVALPSEQKVVVGSGAAAAMTVEKLRQAKEIFDANEVADFYTRYVAIDSAGLRQLLSETETTSSDFNTVKALVNGQLDTFMGFKFIRSERLQTITGTVKGGIAWVAPALKMGVAQSPVSIAAERPDKRHDWQLYTYGSWGAVRVDDEMVVEIAYDTAV
jgi:hypothetical protein